MSAPLNFGVVRGSGGVRSIAALGMVEVLAREGLMPDLIVGCSAGAMFGALIGLVQIKLPVPLGSDAHRVRELLMEAFAADAEVLDSPAPAVLLDGVDREQLLFNATGYVNSPRSVARVRSALLFDVLARLRDAGITPVPATQAAPASGSAAAPPGSVDPFAPAVSAP